MEILGFDDIEEIADGGFSTVYRAYQREFNRTVAIKVLNAPLNDRTRPRFDRERRTLGSLSTHPHILTVFGSGVMADGRGYLVFEDCPGGSLGARVVANGPMPWRDVMPIIVKLAGALSVAHDSGVIHRDVKPDNLLVTQHGEPVLADFGIAWESDDFHTTTGMVTASLAHAAPEVLAGDPATASSDLYSLASTAYHLIGGIAPFRRSTDESPTPMLARILRDPPPDLRVRGVPDAICKVLEQAMSKTVADRRFETQTFAAQLASAIRSPESGSIASTPTEPIDQKGAINEEAEAKKAQRSSTETRSDPSNDAAIDIDRTVLRPAYQPASGSHDDVEQVIEVTATVTVGRCPKGIGFDGRTIWVANSDDNTVTRLDPKTATATAVVKVGRGPEGIECDGTHIWVANFDEGTVTCIEPVTAIAAATVKVGNGPEGIAYDGTNVWITNSSDGTVMCIDPATATIAATLNVGKSPGGIGFDGTNIWVANFDDETVTRIDALTAKITATVAVGSGPEGIGFDGTNIWVANSGTNSVMRIDPLTATVTATVTVGNGPEGVECDGTHIWVANFDDGTVTCINPVWVAVVATVEVGAGPEGIGFDGSHIWVTNFDGGTVTRVRVRSLDVQEYAPFRF